MILVFVGYFIYGHSVTLLAKMFDLHVREVQRWLRVLRKDIRKELSQLGGRSDKAGRLVDSDPIFTDIPSRTKHKEQDDSYQDLDAFIEQSFYE